MQVAATAVSTDHLHGDEPFAELSQGDIERIERHAYELAAAKLGDADWWDDATAGLNSLTAELPDVLAKIGSNFIAAETADARGREILDAGNALALLRFMRIAKDRALAEGREAAERALEEGGLA